MLLDITIRCKRNRSYQMKRREETPTWLPTDNQAFIIRVFRISEVKEVDHILPHVPHLSTSEVSGGKFMNSM